ncbi:dynamin family protein [Melioribacteraceae bacterium 4301-Me]|uniref:dynamin family protein n=1 Tax=Pyranulibacter aquaticus TaxID=3163344 RepID=UPI003599A61C
MNENNIYKTLNQLKDISTVYSLFTIMKEIDELSEKVKQKKFYLVILGMFKRGKSTFINALLENEILPTAVVPLTSVITLIEYGNETSAEVSFRDDTKLKIPVEKVGEYISEEENKLNCKNVSIVRIYSPSEILKNISIIDTPGVGSTLSHNTLTTYEFIEKIDAAVFLLSADNPLSQIEINFLKDLKENVPKILFVLNKIDLLTDKEIDKIVSFNKNELNQLFDGTNYDFYLVSSKYALEGYRNKNNLMIEKSKIIPLRDKLESFVETEKNDLLLISTKNRISIIAKKIKSLLDFELNSMKMPLEELKNQYQSFQQSLDTIKKDKDEFDIVMNGRIKQLQAFVTDEITKLKNTLCSEFIDPLLLKPQHTVTNIKELGAEEYQIKIFNEIRDRFDKLKSDLESEVINKFKELIKKYYDGSNGFLRELTKTMSINSDVSFESLSSTFDLDVYTSFYYKFDVDYIPIALKSSFLSLIMPKHFIEKKIVTSVADNLKNKIEMNCGRINYDINYKIQESFIKFRYDINQKLEETLITLDELLKKTLQEKDKKETNISSKINELTERINLLDFISVS